MADRAPAAPGAWWRTLAFTAATAALTAGAAMVMFSAFMYYDDEGYVLMSLKNFAEHGGLYRDVYSQYGPFPFVFHYLLHAAGMPFTHVAGRLVTLAAWTGTALCCADLVRRATGSLAACLVVLAATFAYLWVMVSEPSHPGGLIAVLVAALAAFSYRALLADHIRAWACAAGAVAVALALTKINVGGFIVLAGLAWILLHHENPVVRRWARPVLVLGALLLPLGLMHTMLGTGWVQTFAVIFACAAAAAVIAGAEAGSARTNWKALGWCALSGAVVGVLVLGVIFARGTAPRDALEGILLAPLKQPVAFNLRYTWPAGAIGFAVASLAGCVGALTLRRKAANAVDLTIALARIAAAVGLVIAFLRFPAASADRIVFSFGAPCLWFFLWPLHGETSREISARTWLGLLWLGQFLHAFPVAGSQIAWGTFLALPLTTIGAYQTIRWLHAPFAVRSTGPRRVLPLLGQAATATLALAIGLRFKQVAERYHEGSDLELPGAELLRLPTQSTALFRILTLNAAAHADMLFSEPGMFSFNFWTGLPAPTLANVTHWFSLLNPERQRAIIHSLEQHPRACVIIQRSHMDYLTERSFAPAGELHDYLTANFRPAFTLDGFEFCVRQGRAIDPILLGGMQLLHDRPNEPNTVLRLRVLLGAKSPVARIELTSPQSPPGGGLAFHSGNARVELTRTDARGSPLEPGRMTPWPFQIEGPAIVTIHFDRFQQPQPIAGSLITLRAPDGSEAALARLRE